MGDDGLLLRMLDNLIRNSITHNPQGCTITLSVGETDGHCLCTVSDDGVGIPAPLLESLNLGNNISSTQESNEKTEHGLGLKLAAQIVTAHQGTIRFADNAPHGLKVSVYLPGK